MSYKIEYCPSDKKRYPGIKERRKTKYGNWVMVILAFAVVLSLRLYGIPDFLIPGDPQVTKAAASLMIDQLQNGDSLGDAVAVFCKEILHGAGF